MNLKKNFTRENLEQLQLERLQATLNRCYHNVAFYREAFDRMNIDLESIDSLSKLSILPFTTRDTLIKNYPYRMFAVPLREVVRLHCSFSCGEPVVVGYTRNDIDHWTKISMHILEQAGVNRDDVVQICFDYGIYGGGLGFHYGAEAIGASVIPGSDLDPAKQLTIMRDYRSTVVLCTPSFALRLIEVMRKKGISVASLNLRCGIFTGEPLSPAVKLKIGEELKIKVFETYGPFEIPGPRIAAECDKNEGLHIFEDQFIPEVIDPATGTPLPPGREGELVITTIAKEAFPLIRYRTGDVTRLNFSPCGCGGIFVRMESVRKRTDDMLFVNGVTFFPSQIGKILTRIEETKPNFQIIIRREGAQDIVEIMVEVSENIFFDEMKKFNRLKEEIEENIYRTLGIKTHVKLVEKRSFSFENLPQVMDLRER
ncbi:phenylacetate--CoA ligase [Candidatus Aerophobetes bacterium]|nr:phenylacetate--CoA ligase [Candidatus Aerophobetes bacterium]